jgi:hypothetical protein
MSYACDRHRGCRVSTLPGDMVRIKVKVIRIGLARKLLASSSLRRNEQFPLALECCLRKLNTLCLLSAHSIGKNILTNKVSYDEKHP